MPLHSWCYYFRFSYHKRLVGCYIYCTVSIVHGERKMLNTAFQIVLYTVNLQQAMNTDIKRRRYFNDRSPLLFYNYNQSRMIITS